MKKILFLAGMAGCVTELPTLETTSRVAQCALDTDCPVDRPACVSGVCQPCADERHCNGAAPICYENQCIECLVNEDCPDGKAVCQNQLCIDCLQDADCSAPEPVCIEQSCLACRTNSDCPLDQALCIGNACQLDPDGRAAWDHRSKILPGAHTLHGIELNQTVALEHIQRLQGSDWVRQSISEPSPNDWSLWADANGHRVGIHRTGLVVTYPSETESLIWTPRLGDLRINGPGLRRDIRATIGYGVLFKFVSDLATYDVIDSMTPVRLLNNSDHRFAIKRPQFVLVDDLVFGKIDVFDRSLPAPILAELKSKFWPEPIISYTNTRILSFKRTLRFRLMQSAQIKLLRIAEDPLFCTNIECTDCRPEVQLEIDGEPIEGAAASLDAGEHSVEMTVTSSQADGCLNDSGALASKDHPPAWWRILIEGQGEIELRSWDYGDNTRASYNQNRRPVVLNLVDGDYSDLDGDHYPDSSDLCPYDFDGQRDADQDGVGDRCDGVMAIERISEDRVAAWNSLDEPLYEVEAGENASLFRAFIVDPTNYPDRDEVNHLAGEYATVIKSTLDTPARVLDSSGETIFETFEGTDRRLKEVASDGSKVGLMARQFDFDYGLRTYNHFFTFSGIGRGAVRKTKTFHTHSIASTFTMIPRDNVISSFLSPDSMMFVTAQSMRPIHFVRLPSVLIPGFNGTCSSSLECGDGICASYSCSLGNTDRCQPGQRSAGICYPTNDIGYCIRRSAGTVLPSSFSSCEPEGVACEIGSSCPGSQRCILGRCKQDCHILSDPPDCAENQICLGSGNNTLSERGLCTTLVQDDACPTSERCIAGSDLIKDLPYQLLQRFQSSTANDATFGTSINTLWAVGLSENMMQNGPSVTDLGEFGWCLPELTQSTQNSLTEDQSRRRLRQLFDRTTPWHEIFVPGRLKSDVTLYDNYWGFNHAYLQGCHQLDVPINISYPRNLVALRVELIDLNGDGFDEFRVHFGVGSEATTASIWRCYDAFGDRIISNCTP